MLEPHPVLRRQRPDADALDLEADHRAVIGLPGASVSVGRKRSVGDAIIPLR